MTNLPELVKLKITRQDIYDNKAFTKEDIDKIITVIIDSPEGLFDNDHKGLSKLDLLDLYYQARRILKGSDFFKAQFKLYLNLEN